MEVNYYSIDNPGMDIEAEPTNYAYRYNLTIRHDQSSTSRATLPLLTLKHRIKILPYNRTTTCTWANRTLVEPGWWWIEHWTSSKGVEICFPSTMNWVENGNCLARRESVDGKRINKKKAFELKDTEEKEEANRLFEGGNATGKLHRGERTWSRESVLNM